MKTVGPPYAGKLHVRWDGNGEPTMTRLVRHCHGKPAATDRRRLKSLNHSLTLDFVVLCRTRAEAQRALATAARLLHEELGVRLRPQKTRIVHVSQGFEFLGYKVKQGTGHRLPASKRRSRSNPLNLYAVPREKSITRFREQIRKLTRRKAPLTLWEMIERINPVIRGWGTFYRKADVRRLYARVAKRWRNTMGRRYATSRLIREFGLVRLIHLIPGLVQRCCHEGAAQESGLRENCTSRLIERTEGGPLRPTSSDSTVRAWESWAHQDEDCRRRPLACGKTGPKVPSARASCPRVNACGAGEMGRNASCTHGEGPQVLSRIP